MGPVSTQRFFYVLNITFELKYDDISVWQLIMSAKQSRIFKVVYFLDIRVSAVGKLTGLLARQPKSQG